LKRPVSERTHIIGVSADSGDCGLDTYPGWETPNPILVEIVRGAASEIETVLADILGLTKLNYNACEFSASMPVTLSFADAVGEILMAAPSENTPPLPFRYYI
jgi:hypothetical protein